MVKGYVLVVDGSRGIGRAIAFKFSNEGYYVVFTYLNRLDAANETLKMLKNVSVKSSVRKCYKLISSEILYLNVLINNAGVPSMKSIDKLSLDE